MTDEELKGFGIYREDGVIIGCPGVKGVEQDAATTVRCTVSPQLSGEGGVYCADCDIAELVPDDSQLPSGVRCWAIDKSTANALWA